MDVTGFGLKKEDVSFYRFPGPCFLVVHLKGTLMWDAGIVPDSAWKYTGAPVTHKVILPDRQREITLLKPLRMQLSEISYSPAEITYLALSHYHYDHTRNAYQFANSTWLVSQNEYDAMFTLPPPKVTLPSYYSSLKKSKIQIITKDEYDVFSDGTVIIKSAPGHTPGHQVLFLKLKKTGNIVLSGDLYHYPEEKTLDKVPNFEFNTEQTRATRKMIDTFLKNRNATLWIQHDLTKYETLKKSPVWYE
ncbi:MAG: N-acyl homoserine lactonase family protein [Ginsengibacter sp.]